MALKDTDDKIDGVRIYIDREVAKMVEATDRHLKQLASEMRRGFNRVENAVTRVSDGVDEAKIGIVNTKAYMTGLATSVELSKKTSALQVYTQTSMREHLEQQHGTPTDSRNNKKLAIVAGGALPIGGGLVYLVVKLVDWFSELS